MTLLVRISWKSTNRTQSSEFVHGEKKKNTGGERQEEGKAWLSRRQLLEAQWCDSQSAIALQTGWVGSSQWGAELRIESLHVLLGWTVKKNEARLPLPINPLPPLPPPPSHKLYEESFSIGVLARCAISTQPESLTHIYVYAERMAKFLRIIHLEDIQGMRQLWLKW